RAPGDAAPAAHREPDPGDEPVDRDRCRGLRRSRPLWTRFGRPGGSPYPCPDESAGRPMNVVTIRDLDVAFGNGLERIEVLRGLDLDIAPGHLTAVVGPSGCGKTTLLRAIAGFVAPDAGTVSIDGTVVAGAGVHVPPEKRGVTLVPQEGA